MLTSSEPNQLGARRRRWAGALRVALYLCVLAAGVLCWCVRAAYAEIERSVLHVGEKLASELGPGILGPPQTVQINGQTLFLGSKHSGLSVRQVLDQFAASCGSRGSEPRAHFAHAPDRGASAAEPSVQAPDLAGFNVLRMESDGEGRLACFARPQGQNGLAGMLSGLRGLLETGDLSRLGALRYVTARKLQSGETHVVAIWSEGELRMTRLFPESGDAPGSDMDDVPRPPAATRGLCALAPGRSYALRLYDSPRPAADVLAFYDRELPRRGWEAVPSMLDDGTLRPGVFVRSFTRAGQAVAIAVEASADGPTGISLIDLGGARRSAFVDAEL